MLISTFRPQTLSLLIFEGDNCVIIRPSGTEPKIKLYITAVGKSHDDAVEICNRLVESAKKTLGF